MLTTEPQPYVFDAQDPIVTAYRRIFPSLFKDAATMPADLHKHVRYPEDLFKVQAERSMAFII
jgi:uncharacterized protein